MLEAERAVIGSLLIDQDQITAVHAFLKPEMFSEWVYRRMYEEFCRAYDGEYQLDYILLIKKMENDNIAVDTLRSLISSLVQETPTSMIIKSAAGIILEEWRRREIKAILRKERNTEKACDEVNAIVGELQSLLVSNSTGITLANLTVDIKDDYFKGKDSTFVKMGVSGLDDIVKNLEAGDVTVLAARPSVGKSAFMVQIATNLGKEGRCVGFFSLEMSKRQIYERFVSHISGISLDRVRFATYYLNDEKQNYERAVDELERKQNIIIYADDMKTKCPRTASQIEAACRSDGIKIAIIDYLQLMSPEKTYQGNKAAEVGEISRKIKEIAMRLGIHVIALSQMSRNIEYRANQKPMLSDLRESGAIEQDASNIIFLWNKDSNNKQRKGCMVAKQRQGGTGEIELIFDGAHMTFRAVEGKNDFVPTAERPFG